MKVITFFNNKGGVGKTTTVVNLSSYLVKKYGYRILLMDLDPQSNSSQLIIPEDRWDMFYSKGSTQKTIIDLFSPIQRGEPTISLDDISLKGDETRYGIDLIPSHPRLSLIEDIMSESWSNIYKPSEFGSFRKLNWLKQFIDYNRNIKLNDGSPKYNYIFIDVGPSLGALNRSILLNTDYFITPMGSDIFSILGLENIAEWIESWVNQYDDAIRLFRKKNTDQDENLFIDYHVNFQPHQSTRFIGYLVQLYSMRKFSEGPRAVKSYEDVITQVPNRIYEHLSRFMKNGLTSEQLRLGDIPYVYSLVPLSQTSKTPIYELDYSCGIRGGQSSSVTDYTKYIDIIAKNLIRNIDQ